MTIKKKYDGIYVDDSILESLSSVDGIIFDCDGVLIDITKSYDLTINKTTQYALELFANIKDGIVIDPTIIDRFKSTGGFNDEVDLAYGAIISIIAAKKLEKKQQDFIFEVISNANSTGIISVEKYIEKFVDISEIRKKLSYPGKHNENTLYKIFDQIFYGPELYKKLFHQNSQFSELGLIENDVIILDNLLIKKLKTKFSSKMSIVTGRGKESIKYSLKKLLDEFDLNNSIFLEDESRDLAKPNPESLIQTIKGMKCNYTLYVGDSMEDFIMATKANDLDQNTIFCGIIGTSTDPQKKLKLFEQKGVKLVLDSIHLLPKVLNLD